MVLFKVDSIHGPITDTSEENDFNKFINNIRNKIGVYKEKRVRAYRIPNSHSILKNPFNCYVSFILRGDISDCHLEISCNSKIQNINWPSTNDFSSGKRVVIELFDWVDVYWLVYKINNAFK
ncbi:hypothetical protein [Gilliamella apicola]|uniref:hypothetical protein n=1 Tax=Gilliamella apicola TaxID=1196095 RepID=UPI00046C8DE9|nr:hypothetical protein [Gilliamella apicola]PXV96584.1 hypothetical protein C7392_103156 [Gilliamella apicola]